ncbi:hypothetical protein WAJ07_20935, partial [Acinetobacter baumannii]
VLFIRQSEAKHTPIKQVPQATGLIFRIRQFYVRDNRYGPHPGREDYRVRRTDEYQPQDMPLPGKHSATGLGEGGDYGVICSIACRTRL